MNTAAAMTGDHLDHLANLLFPSLSRFWRRFWTGVAVANLVVVIVTATILGIAFFGA